MTKEEKIQNAWIEVQNHAESEGVPFLNEDGWARYSSKQNSEYFKTLQETQWLGYYFYRPKTLIGIEDNNGWNKISEVGYPTDETVNYHVLHIDFPEVQEIALMKEVDKRFTHWKRIENPINPIY